MSQNPLISVIIPTYNREGSLRRLLESLCAQTIPMDQLEVVVVDDGSTDGTQALASQPFLFYLVYLRQKNLGATQARNTGARDSRGEILVFVDDDFRLLPDTLALLAEECQREARTIILGNQVTPESIRTSVFAQNRVENSVGILAQMRGVKTSNDDIVEQDGRVHFTLSRTGLMAVKRADFFDIGMFQDPTGGWPNWDDVDFGYRAHRMGFIFRKSGRAVGEHWDYALADLRVSCLRWLKAGKSAVRLFEKYPDLKREIPMFSDKTEIIWGQDSAALILRKLVRRAASTSLSIKGMEILARLLERMYPTFSSILGFLYLWIHGGYMFRGYQAGLREARRAGGAGS